MGSDKALVIKTGEILNIKTHYIKKIMNLTFELPEYLKDTFEKMKSDIEVEYKDDNISEHKEGDYYTLSDNNKYMGYELIVGIDNIRDYKISNQIKIDE